MSAMNLPNIHRTCSCYCKMHSQSIAKIWLLKCQLPFVQMPKQLLLDPSYGSHQSSIHRRNMSIWGMAKTRFKRAWTDTVKLQSETEILKFGVDIGTAHMLVKLGARVQFTNGKWYSKEDVSQRELPVEELQDKYVVAIDAKGTHLDKFSISDVVKLSHLKFLSVEDCPLIDDQCLGSLVHLRETLTHLNLNKCTEVTENGIATLHKLRNLERLNMNDMPKVKHASLVAVMLEDVLPKLHISLVSQQVENYIKQAKEGMEIINRYRKAAGLLDEHQDDQQDDQDRESMKDEGKDCSRYSTDESRKIEIKNKSSALSSRQR